MINHMPFFRSPFPPYLRSYPRNHNHTPDSVFANTQKTLTNYSPSHTEIRKNGDTSNQNHESKHEKKSSKYFSIGPIFINTEGLSNQEKPVLEISGQKIYLDDVIILALLYFLYKEEVKDDMLFILLILLLIG